MDTAFARQLEPFRLPAAIHAMRARRGIPIITASAVTSHQLVLGQAMEKWRVLLVAMNVVHLEVHPNSQRIHPEHFGSMFDFRKLRRARHFGTFLHGRSRIETVTYVPVPACE